MTEKLKLGALRRDVRRAMQENSWDLSNRVIYEMCARYPYHRTNGEIAGKLLIIGRVYSAAIERRKTKKTPESDFYLDEALPRIRGAKFDSLLQNPNLKKEPTVANAHHFIQLHQRINGVFAGIAGQSKRSLASKYLHFHRPTKFFIFDSRAAKGLANMMRELGLNGNKEIKIVQSRMKKHQRDAAYMRHFVRCLILRGFIRATCKVTLTPRELDKLLLRLFD